MADLPPDIDVRLKEAGHPASAPYAELREFAKEFASLLWQNERRRLVLESAEASKTMSQRREDDSLVISVSPDDALVAVERTRWLKLADGVLLVPVLAAFIKHGIFEVLAEHPPTDLCTLARRFSKGEHWTAVLGNLYGVLRALALEGWCAIGADSENPSISLTPSGKIASTALKALAPSVTLAATFLQRGTELPRVMRRNEGGDKELRSTFERLVSALVNRWDVDRLVDKSADAWAVGRVLALLDGAVLVPVVTALDMPPRTDPTSGPPTQPSAIETLLQSKQGCSPEELATRCGINPAWLAPAVKALAHAGYFEDSDGRCSMSTLGAAVGNNGALRMAAVSTSYLPLFNRVEDYLFTASDPLGVARDNHIDRPMNIHGSAAMSRVHLSSLCKQVLTRTFDALPLEEQPAGISDIGCGSGLPLLEMARYIINNTERGRRLADHPLIVVGADYFDPSLQKTRESLRGLDGLSGVVTAVVRANVADPAGYDRALRELVATGALPSVGIADLLHTMMFLCHNRPLTVTSVEEAKNIIADALGSAPRSQVKRALAAALDTEPGNLDDAELLRTVTAQFATHFSGPRGLVPGVVIAADLLAFFQRWRPYSKRGLVLIENHYARASDLFREPQAKGRWRRSDLVWHFGWISHALSQQYPLPFVEHQLVLALAGLLPEEAFIFGDAVSPLPRIQRYTRYCQFSLIHHRATPEVG